MSQEEKVPTFSLKLAKLRITDLSSHSVSLLGQPTPNFLLPSFNFLSSFKECRYIGVLGHCGTFSTNLLVELQTFDALYVVLLKLQIATFDISFYSCDYY